MIAFFKVVFLVRRTTLWQEFMLHHDCFDQPCFDAFIKYVCQTCSIKYILMFCSNMFDQTCFDFWPNMFNQIFFDVLIKHVRSNMFWCFDQTCSIQTWSIKYVQSYSLHQTCSIKTSKDVLWKIMKEEVLHPKQHFLCRIVIGMHLIQLVS